MDQPQYKIIVGQQCANPDCRAHLTLFGVRDVEQSVSGSNIVCTVSCPKCGQPNQNVMLERLASS